MRKAGLRRAYIRRIDRALRISGGREGGYCPERPELPQCSPPTEQPPTQTEPPPVIGLAG